MPKKIKKFGLKLSFMFMIFVIRMDRLISRFCCIIGFHAYYGTKKKCKFCKRRQRKHPHLKLIRGGKRDIDLFFRE